MLLPHILIDHAIELRVIISIMPTIRFLLSWYSGTMKVEEGALEARSISIALKLFLGA